MITEEFKIGFWHPFGPHGGETPEEIIKRKQNEIDKNGWTLWSFQSRNTLKKWFEKIEEMKPDKVFVFCSEGKGSKEPVGEIKNCSLYTPINGLKSKEIPHEIKIPHPMGKKLKGSAFIVKNIIYPASYEDSIYAEWLKDDKWQATKVPTRPEYLIKSGSGNKIRKFRAVLELKYPYLAEIS
ncbi:MAG: hypothetical protein WCW46_01675 [Candidatus Paceibacterota bacterium]|jgi:hypothetical protein